MLKYVWKAATGFARILWGVLDWIRRAIVNLVLLVLIIAVGFGLCWDGAVSVPAGSYLRISFSGTIAEQPALNEDSFVGTLSGSGPETRLHDVLRALETAAADPDIAGVVMRFDDFDRAGLASIREIAAAMESFKKSGKKITAWASSYSQAQYAIAAHASEIYLHPMGQVLLKGLGSTRLYWGDALREAGVNVHVFKAGEYKSFPEVFVRRGPSEESLSSDLSWMQNAWRQLTDSIEGARGLIPGSITQFMDSYPEKLKAADGNMSEVALAENLVDGIAGEDAVNDILVERQGGTRGRDSLKMVDYTDYLDARPEKTSSGRGIAVITIEGEIREGTTELGFVGARSTVKLIREAALDPTIAALVVRVDSPGGSAVASEIIRREIERVKESGKPVVVSTGDYAASGGYWLSLAANRVVSDPSTVTGSIGVFGVMPTFEGVLERFSVGAGGARTSWLASSNSLLLPVDPRFEEIMELSVARTYRDFTSLVARSRNLPMEKVMELAQGRVYTGAQAVELGLADMLGGISDAFSEARRLTDLPASAPVHWFEEDPGTVRMIISKFLLSMRARTSPLASLPEEIIPSGQTGIMMNLVKEAGKPVAHCLCSFR